MDVFHQLSIRELNELKTDISAYGELDQGNASFWHAMTYMCEHLLQARARMPAAGMRRAV